MEEPISISNLNDFVFCPASIYFHKLYGNYHTMLLQNTSQICGTNTHETLDKGGYSSKKGILTGLSVYCEKYNLIGKIDCYFEDSKEIMERKKKIKTIYDGYVFQLYAQLFAMEEMGYIVENLSLYSYDDNKKYAIPLPHMDKDMWLKFEDVIAKLWNFDLSNFRATNREKCIHCIYEPICDKSLV